VVVRALQARGGREKGSIAPLRREKGDPVQLCARVDPGAKLQENYIGDRRINRHEKPTVRQATATMNTAAIPDAGPRRKTASQARPPRAMRAFRSSGAVRTASHYGAVAIFGTLIVLLASPCGPAWALPLIVAPGF